jgi:CBS domain-containing protein
VNETVRVRDVMTTALVTIELGATIAEAATVMGANRVGSALVLSKGDLVGIFTERDIVRVLASHFDGAGHRVEDWMSRGPVTIDPDAPLATARRLMLSHGFRHLPVVTGGRIEGVLSMRDLVAAGEHSEPA